MQTLTVINCDCGDALCMTLHSSKSLLQLRIGTSYQNAEDCGITEKWVLFIVKISQLEELILGISQNI